MLTFYNAYFRYFIPNNDLTKILPLLFRDIQAQIGTWYTIYIQDEKLVYVFGISLLFISIFFLIYLPFHYAAHFRLYKQKELLQRAFSQYVSSSLMKDILDHPESLVLGGKSAYLTVYFVDIEGFSDLMTEYHPKKIVEYLNDYFSEMSEVILENHGTIDKYEGDAIMAFWGAPKPQEDHTVLACRTALKHQKKLLEMREKWEGTDHPDFKAKIGIASGDMVVGNIGSAGFFNYTVIGRAVNSCVQIEKYNKVYGTKILVSEKTYHKAKHDFEFREIDEVELKGYKHSVRLFELLAEKGKLTGTQSQLVSFYHEALDAFRNRNWENAKKAINDCLRIAPEDLASQLLKDKITKKMAVEKKANAVAVKIKNPKLKITKS